MNKEEKIVSPKDFFLHVGSIIALYVSAFALLTLLFQIIQNVFPDESVYWRGNYSGPIRSAIASLIVVFPIYIFLSWLLEKSYKLSPEKLETAIRRWLGYFTIFIAGLAIVINLIVLLNYFLKGELLLNFSLKVVSVFLVSGLIFSYYICDLRGKIDPRKKKIYAYLAGILVLLSLILGFLVMGSPMKQRLQNFDDTKISNLQSIQYYILDYWRNTGKLPENLETLNDSVLGVVIPNDPQTKESYGYETISNTDFVLCAKFNLDSDSLKMTNSYYPKDENWDHEKGEFCFDRSIDPERIEKTSF